MKKKKTLILMFAIFSIIGYFYKPPEALDLYRYYEFYEKIDSRMGIYDLIKERFLLRIDFIYYLVILISKKLMFKKEIFNSLFFSLYFIEILKLYLNYSSIYCKNLKLSKKEKYIIMLYILLSMPVIHVLTISRTTAALLFVFIGINKIIKKKNSIIYFILAIFTHVGILIWLAIFFVGYNFEILKIRNKKIMLVITVVSANYLQQILIMVFAVADDMNFFKNFKHYSIYLKESIGIFEKYTYSTIIPFCYSGIILVFLLLSIKRYNKIIWGIYYNVILLFLFMGISSMFFDRTLMFLQGFTSILILKALDEKIIFKYKKILFTLLMIGIIIQIGCIYAYRNSFSWY